MLMPEASDLEEDPGRGLLSDIYRKSAARIDNLYREDGRYNYLNIGEVVRLPVPVLPPTTDHGPIQEPPRKKAKRTINEDDYDDEDEEEGDEDTGGPDSQSSASFKHKNAAAASTLLSPSKSGSSPVQSVNSPPKPGDASKVKEEGGAAAATSAPGQGSQLQTKTAEDARKQLEEARNATEEVATRAFHTLIYTLENDRTAMLEQQQLEESERQLQAEMEKNAANGGAGPGGNGGAGGVAGARSAEAAHASLSSANLGASSLTLKHLLARIDQKRDQVRASDAELRSLINEVKKNRSRWANEENVNQEELYEALDKVLTELKAHTEFSTPFLQRVNKRDAPDYYNRKLTRPCLVCVARIY